MLSGAKRCIEVCAAPRMELPSVVWVWDCGAVLDCKMCGGGVLVGMGYLYLRYGKFDRSTL